jgi:hypothetical protein
MGDRGGVFDEERILSGCSLSPGYGSGTAYIYHAGTAPTVSHRSITQRKSARRKGDSRDAPRKH